MFVLPSTPQHDSSRALIRQIPVILMNKELLQSRKGCRVVSGVGRRPFWDPDRAFSLKFGRGGLGTASHIYIRVCYS